MISDRHNPGPAQGCLIRSMAVCLLALLLCSCGGTAQTRGVGKEEAAVHKIRFPKEWAVGGDDPGQTLSYVQQLEVRRLPGSPANELFFAALPYGDNDYSHEIYSDVPKP